MAERPDLTDPGTLARFVEKHGLSPQKRLGQHWLFGSKTVSAIVSACGDAGGILEIGPGPGVITQRLSNVVALDVDPRVGGALAESAPSARVVIGDVLTVDLESLLLSLAAPRGVVGNLPYNISSAILGRLIEVSHAFDFAVLMMQREVAQRIMAVAGSSARGSLSVDLESRFSMSVVCHVPPGAFMPPPRVDSTVVRLDMRSPVVVSPLVLRAGFKQPRKTLANNLSTEFSRSDVCVALGVSGLPEKIRPHELTLSQWVELSRRLVHS